jgi:hypothetical protein
MVQLNGTYDKGNIILDKEISFDRPVKVVVTFMDEDVTVEKKRLTGDDFSFAKSRELLKNLHTSLSDAVIEERRSYL